MKAKRFAIFMNFLLLVALILLLVFYGMGRKADWENYKNFYTTVVQETGENDGAAKYLKVAERSAELFPLLEENAGAFVVDAYNFQSIDDEGTPLYTMNGLDLPVELDPYGQCITVSKNYFKYNPIETSDGSDLINQIIYDDLTTNILVPERHRSREAEIVEAYRERFYFEKVQATNDYNADSGISETLDIPIEDLKVNVIYVKDGQQYFTFRADCAAQTDNVITDPIVQIYTSNIHCNYAHSFMTQWLYYHSDKTTAEEAYTDIEPYIIECGAQESIQSVVSVYEANK